MTAQVKKIHFVQKRDSDRSHDIRAYQYNVETPHALTPSLGGKECLGNGTWPGYECQCDECDYFLVCFPNRQ